jgi:hypothetical protein
LAEDTAEIISGQENIKLAVPNRGYKRDFLNTRTIHNKYRASYRHKDTTEIFYIHKQENKT